MIYLLMAAHVCLVIGIMFWFFTRVDKRARKEERERIWWIVRSEYDEAFRIMRALEARKGLRETLIYADARMDALKELGNKIESLK